MKRTIKTISLWILVWGAVQIIGIGTAKYLFYERSTQNNVRPSKHPKLDSSNEEVNQRRRHIEVKRVERNSSGHGGQLQ